MEIDLVSFVRENKVDLNKDGKFTNDDVVMAEKYPELQSMLCNEKENTKSFEGDDFVKDKSSKSSTSTNTQPISGTQNTEGSYDDMRKKLTDLRLNTAKDRAELNKPTSKMVLEGFVGGGIIGGVAGGILGALVGLPFGVPLVGAGYGASLGAGIVGCAGYHVDKDIRDEKREEVRASLEQFESEYGYIPEVKAQIDKIKNENKWL